MESNICIKNIIEWIDSLYKGDGPKLWWFRGHNDSTWKLLPRLFRDFTPETEQSISNHFYTRAYALYNNTPQSDDYAGWISLMQHYGLPTRLLDWSRSVSIALYFAITSGEGLESKSASIWALNPIVFNSMQLNAPYALPISAKKVKPLIMPFLKGKDEEGNEETSKNAAVLSNEIDIRMQVQQSAFTIHTHRRPLEEFNSSEGWLQNIIFDNSSIINLSKDIKNLGISRSTVFPDLNNLAMDIVESYAQPI